MGSPVSTIIGSNNHKIWIHRVFYMRFNKYSVNNLNEVAVGGACLKRVTYLEFTWKEYRTVQRMSLPCCGGQMALTH
jgi:hypothetical protein